MTKRCVAEELQKIGQRPWLKLRTTVLDLTEGLERKVNYVCCLRSITIAGFIAVVGDIRRFDSPKQIQKYAGLELVENSSGKHKGRTRISKRGRRKLRKILYQVMVPLLARNREFREIYDYYVTRVKNPLKRRQAMVAVSCQNI